MERRLFGIMTVGGIGALVFGLWLVADYAWAAFAENGWFRVKLVLAGALVLYHVWCGKLVSDFAAGRNRHGHRFYRLINEVPALILVAVVVLVVVKPAMGGLDG
jgi:putative membrane protein